ncbi:MAG: hypothetical protein CL785_03705 [Chloroflexi bacterium]|nr:hypothetical protein [Chloroflexota bacterium]|tara:strand:- start:11473 stop:11973 length:501 start_codon:yes stop_codon:yes gene_type:complete
MNGIFSFPNPVNEYAARSVATMVVILATATLILNSVWLAGFLAYGFIARVLTGPTLSPMGQLATRIIVPKILKKTKFVPGPPKRFAQFIGLVFSISILLCIIVFQNNQSEAFLTYSRVLLGVLISFAFLEAVIPFCAGCFVFGYLMKFGIIPESVCEACVVNSEEN